MGNLRAARKGAVICEPLSVQMARVCNSSDLVPLSAVSSNLAFSSVGSFTVGPTTVSSSSCVRRDEGAPQSVLALKLDNADKYSRFLSTSCYMSILSGKSVEYKRLRSSLSKSSSDLEQPCLGARRQLRRGWCTYWRNMPEERLQGLFARSIVSYCPPFDRDDKGLVMDTACTSEAAEMVDPHG